MRRFLALVVGVLVVAASGSAQAAIDARLGGEFKMVGRITDSNDGTQGHVRARTYRFTPLCPNGPCRKVSLRREGPENTHYRSVLRRKGPGSYKGKEESGRVRCDGDTPGFQTVKLRFRIVDAENGEATAIRGRARFEADCPGGDVFQKARLYGERR